MAIEWAKNYNLIQSSKYTKNGDFEFINVDGKARVWGFEII